jgi:hypothetical protein
MNLLQAQNHSFQFNDITGAELTVAVDIGSRPHVDIVRKRLLGAIRTSADGIIQQGERVFAPPETPKSSIPGIRDDLFRDIQLDLAVGIHNLPIIGAAYLGSLHDIKVAYSQSSRSKGKSTGRGSDFDLM